MLNVRVTIGEIARQTAISPKTISARRDELGLLRTEFRRLRHPETITGLTLAGKGTAEIAAALDVEEKTVRRHQQYMGLREVDPKCRRAPQVGVQQAKRLREDRVSYLEATRTVRIGADTLIRHFPGLGWTGEDRYAMASLLSTPALRQLHNRFFRSPAAAA